MMQVIPIGLGAGAAAALLFASVATGSIFATLLFYLAPLPIMIAALGWSHWGGLIAALAAAIGLGAVLGIYFGAAFLVGVGLPAWWLAYLSLLARPAPAPGALEWYPTGNLVFWSALLGTMVVLIAIPNFGTDKESFQAGLRTAFEQAINFQATEGANGLPSRADTDRLIELLVVVIPPAAAVLGTLLNMGNLWLAGRVVAYAGHLRRAWPDLTMLTLPRAAPLLLAAGVVGAFVPDLLGIAAGVLVASLITAYAIIGFSVLHSITRGMAHRGLTLAGTYAAVGMLGWPVLGMALLGLADNAFDIRGRFARRPQPPRLRT
jgi:hypothetical protein